MDRSRLRRISRLLVCVGIGLLMLEMTGRQGKIRAEEDTGGKIRQVSLEVIQHFTIERAEASAENSTFSYRLEAMDPASGEKEQSFQMKGNEKRTLQISYDREKGDSYYKIYQVQDAGKKGFIYDPAVYYVRCYLNERGEVLVFLYDQEQKKCEEIAFSCGYKGTSPEPTCRPTTKPHSDPGGNTGNYSAKTPQTGDPMHEERYLFLLLLSLTFISWGIWQLQKENRKKG